MYYFIAYIYGLTYLTIYHIYQEQVCITKEKPKGTIHPFHPQPRYNGSHIPLTAQPIAFIHGHTPLLGKDVLYREVGLSESDRTWAETQNTVVIAHDYVGEYDPKLKKQIIRTGHDKNGPTKNYVALPLKEKE